MHTRSYATQYVSQTALLPVPVFLAVSISASHAQFRYHHKCTCPAIQPVTADNTAATLLFTGIIFIGDSPLVSYDSTFQVLQLNASCGNGIKALPSVWPDDDSNRKQYGLLINMIRITPGLRNLRMSWNYPADRTIALMQAIGLTTATVNRRTGARPNAHNPPTGWFASSKAGA